MFQFLEGDVLMEGAAGVHLQIGQQLGSNGLELEPKDWGLTDLRQMAGAQMNTDGSEGMGEGDPHTGCLAHLGPPPYGSGGRGEIFEIWFLACLGPPIVSGLRTMCDEIPMPPASRCLNMSQMRCNLRIFEILGFAVPPDEAYV